MSGEPLDARLAIAAGASWLAIWGCRRADPATIAMVVAAVGIAAFAALGASVRGWRAGAAVALAGFCVAVVLILFDARIVHAGHAPLTQLARQHASVTAEIETAGDPHPLAATGVAGSPRVGLAARAVALRQGERRVPMSGSVLVLAPVAGWAGLLPGQRLWVDGSLEPSLDLPAMTVVLNVHADPVLVGRPPWWQRLAGTVRSSLRRACAGLPSEPRGLLPGLVDGDTAGIDPVLQERFRLAGLTHLIAVSGTNCTIVIGTILLLLRRLRARPWVCAVLGGAVLAAFVVVARPTPTVLRAAFMAAIALFALASGRRSSVLPSLSSAVLVLLLWNPQLAWDAGFTMSVLATAALFTLAPRWAQALRRRHVPPVLAESLAVAVAAHLVTAPVIAALSGRVSLVAVPANIAAEPVVAAATVLGFLTAVAASLWLPAGQVFAQAAGWPCRWIVTVANGFGGLHGATVPWPAGLSGGLELLAVVALGIWLLHSSRSRRAMVVAVVMVAVIQIPVRHIVTAWPPKGTVFVACDVGQGDALVLPVGGASAVVIDAGPIPVPIDRCLADLGITDVALLVLTHYHLDHVGGIDGVLRDRHLSAVLSSPLLEPASGVALVDSAVTPRGLSVRVARPGESSTFGPLQLDVLGPAAAMHGTRSDPNNSSVVLRATVRGIRILLTGDAEVEEQQSLLESGVDLRADVLKVPHHGSAYSSPAFLAAVHARAAILSAGLHNDYGLPSPVLLDQLSRLGVPVARTDRDGDVAVVAAAGQLRIVARGTVSSTVGMRDGPVVPSAAGGPRPVSQASARMYPCRPRVPSASTPSPQRCRVLSSSSATRNFWSTARSARSPPWRTEAQMTASSPSWRAATSAARSCTSYWARRCSPTRGW